MMISTELARALRDSGLVWRPRAGDAFRIDLVEADSDLFVLSDMTVEAHEFSTGTVIGFNGTTEWALDSVALDDALWLPREDQLRELLAAAFVRLERVDSTEVIDAVTLESSAYRLTALVGAQSRVFEAPDAADAYARALLALLDSIAE